MQRNNHKSWDYETIEHLTPKSKGGKNALSNIALSHAKCNHERSDKDREPLLLRVAKHEAIAE